MKHIALFFMIGVLLFGCNFLAPPTANTDAVHTAMYETAIAMIREKQTMTANVETITPIFTDTPTPTLSLSPSITSSPFPAEIESLLQDKCEMPWGQVTGNFAVRSPGLFERYTGTGCRLPIFSPNRKHLAYLTPGKLENQDAYVETVEILQTASEKVKTVHLAHEMSYIYGLEWSPTGHLIVQELIWEGPMFVLIYDPTSDSIVTTMRLDPESELHWNAAYTAIYAEHSHDYGRSTCIHELRGYDLAYGNPFPDFYEIFNVEKQENPLLGIPNGKSDDLAIEPFAWSEDGRYIWITIRLLNLLEDEGGFYEVGPSRAGILELRKDEVHFILLASDPDFDYSFEGLPVPEIIASPYQPHRCP